MIHSAKARTSKRAKIAVAFAALLAAAFAIVPNISAASAAEGNQSKDCADTGLDASDRLKAFDSFKIYVNDEVIPNGDTYKINKYVKQGDEVKIKFQLKDKCKDTYVAVSSYKATTKSDSSLDELKGQELYQRKDGTFDSDKSYTLSVKVPPCYFQVDVNTGGKYKPGDYSLDRQGRLLFAAQGGSDSKCTAATTTSTTEKPTTTTTEKPTTTTSSTEAPTTTSTTSPPVTVVTHSPSVSFAQVCSADSSGFTGSMQNKGNVSEDFVINVNGLKADTVTVGAGAKVDKTWKFTDLKIAPDATAVVTVVVNNSVVDTESITNDCVSVSASAVAACDTASGSGAILTFTNEGKVAESFQVTRDGKTLSGSPVSVAAGGTTVQKLLAMNEDESAVINIKATNGTFDLTKTVKLDCVDVQDVVVTAPPVTAAPQVLDETITQPLATTGADLRPWAFGGILAIAVGLGLLNKAYRIRKNA